MKKIFTSVLACGLFATAFAQWSPSQMQGEMTRKNVQAKGVYNLNLEQLRSQLSNAVESGKGAKAIIINLPTLDGTIEQFSVYSAPVMEKSLADKYQLGSYSGVSVNDPKKSIRFSVSPTDFQSMLIVDGKYEFIEAINKDKSLYAVFPKSTQQSKNGKSFECKTSEGLESSKELEKLSQNVTFSHNPNDFSKSDNQKFRTYRLAVSVNAEYTALFNGVAGAYSQINATITRVNGVFEKDFALRLIVQNFPELIFTDPVTDPYSNVNWNSSYQGWTAPSAWNLQLQQTLTSKIGNAAYDIGHFFGHRGGGGSAGDIGNVCRNPNGTNDAKAKGSAITSPLEDDTPFGDNFDIDFVAHEMGHQLGAWHTFAHNLHAGSIAHMEPGSGSTIMGYAGIVEGSNVQMHSDPYFHAISIKQVQDYVTNQTCDVTSTVVNNPPQVAAMADKTIPKGTAFKLTAQATDAENDPLTYTWEQYDSATLSVNNVTENTTLGPKFRSISGSTDPSRYFPKQSMVLAGNLSSRSEWEAVSDIARTMNFRVTVRDNNPDVTQQQTRFADQKITVGNDGPFKVKTEKIYKNATTTNISWDVANTNLPPYNVANVKIDYSLDNGATWVIAIPTTPNTGSVDVDLSSLPLNQNIKLRVSAIDNVFYAVNNASVTNMANCDGTAPTDLKAKDITQTTATITWDRIDGATYNLKYKKADAATFTEVTGLTKNTYNLTNLVLNSEYEVATAAVCSGTVGAYATHTFTTAPVNYCTASATEGIYERIDNVKFADINKSSTSTDGYEDFTAVIGNVSKGATYNFTATGATSYASDQIIVWIDYNQNGDFNDPGEQVFISAKKKSPWTGDIVIPESAKTGLTRMRVRLHDASLTPNSTPCGISKYGQVEDYTLNIGTLAVSDVDTTKNGLQVYPNPANDVLNIQNVRSKSTYQIHNVAGQVVASGSTDGKVVVSKLEKGLYIISVESDGKKSTSKFIKN